MANDAAVDDAIFALVNTITGLSLAAAGVAPVATLNEGDLQLSRANTKLSIVGTGATAKLKFTDIPHTITIESGTVVTENFTFNLIDVASPTAAFHAAVYFLELEPNDLVVEYTNATQDQANTESAMDAHFKKLYSNRSSLSSLDAAFVSYSLVLDYYYILNGENYNVYKDFNVNVTISSGTVVNVQGVRVIAKG
jgi:hypothetical protein